MTQSWVNVGWQLRTASYWAVIGAITLTECCISAYGGNYALAQIIPDQTLGTESSLITPNVNVNGSPAELIEGGASRGANLFHSFQEFNVDRGERVYFANPTGIDNILSRVTGTNPSNILGTLGVNGGANLFFLNPNGIVFGADAVLDLKGSFVGTTADSIKFADGREFSAIAAQTEPLLSVSVTVPIGLQFGENPGAILVQELASSQSGGNNPPELTDGERIDQRVNPNPPEFLANQVIQSVKYLVDNIVEQQAVGLAVQPGKTLALIGGEVMLEGGQLKAPQGRIELGSVAGNSLVSLTPIPQGWALGYEGVQNFQDINLSRQAFVDASGSGGGDIQVRGKGVTLTEESLITAGTLGNLDGGEILVRAEQLKLESGSLVATFNQETATGKSGNLTIEIDKLIVQDSIIGSGILGQGDSGNLTVKAKDSVELMGTTPDVQLPGGLFVITGGTGAGGTLMIDTRQLIVRDGARVTVNNASEGRGGTVEVKASESIELIGESDNNLFFSSGIFASSFGRGDAGEVEVKTGSLIVRDGAEISANTRLSKGGNVTVSASDFIELSGTTADGQFESGIKAFAISTEDVVNNVWAGRVEIDTRKLTVRDGAQLSATGFGTGQGGILEVSASESIELMGESANRWFSSGILAPSFGLGSAGQVEVKTGTLTVANGALISAAGFGTSQGGNVKISASESIELIGSGGLDNELNFSTVTAKSEGPGNSGNINIETQRLIVRDGADISVTAFGDGKSGELFVNASESIELIGARSSSDGSQFSRSGLFAATEGTQDGGNLTVITPRLVVKDGARISTSTRGSGQGENSGGQGGDLRVISESVELSGTSADGRFPSGLFALSGEERPTIPATAATGDGGNLSIKTGRLSIRDGAEVSVSAQGEGVAGNIKIITDSIQLDNGTITGETASGEGGDITLRVQDLLLMRNNSMISTTAGTAQDGGNGGKIVIDAENGFIVAVPNENSDIAANAFKGNGGTVEITAQGIFGIEPRQDPTPLSDITASSSGGGVDGEVDINILTGIDPRSSLNNLEEEPIEIDLTEGCQAGEGQTSASFINIGSGGSLPRLDEAFNREVVTTAWIELELGEENGSELVMARDSFRLNQETQKEISPEEDREISSTQESAALTWDTLPCWFH